MRYRCAHCYEPLTVEDGVVLACSQHPDGGIEWSDDQSEWQPVGDGDDVPLDQ